MRSHRFLAFSISVLAFALVGLVAACGGPAAAAPAPAAPVSAPPVAAAPEASAGDDPCPPGTLKSAESQGGACLQPSVLGEDKVNACGARLEKNGWQPDPQAAKLIGERMGQPVRCWRAPAK